MTLFDESVTRSSMMAISNKTTTGPQTRNMERGSGGDRNAPIASAENQRTVLFLMIVSGNIRPDRINTKAIKGTWNPIAEAVSSPTTKPSHEPIRHVASSPEEIESAARYSRRNGINIELE